MMYGCIGERLSHSFSKEIHEILNPSASYELCELAPEELSDFLKKREFRAINVTIPYKQSVIPFLDEVDELARQIGAVNTVVNRSGRLYGYNTDFFGMRALLEYARVSVKEKKGRHPRKRSNGKDGACALPISRCARNSVGIAQTRRRKNRLRYALRGAC